MGSQRHSSRQGPIAWRGGHAFWSICASPIGWPMGRRACSASCGLLDGFRSCSPYAPRCGPGGQFSGGLSLLTFSASCSLFPTCPACGSYAWRLASSRPPIIEGTVYSAKLDYMLSNLSGHSYHLRLLVGATLRSQAEGCTHGPPCQLRARAVEASRYACGVWQ